MAEVVKVHRTGGGERLGVLGTAARGPGGWRFIPAVSGRKPSRREWPTWEQSLPAWVGYPSRCETEVVR